VQEYDEDELDGEGGGGKKKKKKKKKRPEGHPEW